MPVEGELTYVVESVWKTPHERPHRISEIRSNQMWEAKKAKKMEQQRNAKAMISVRRYPIASVTIPNEDQLSVPEPRSFTSWRLTVGKEADDLTADGPISECRLPFCWNLIARGSRQLSVASTKLRQSKKTVDNGQVVSLHDQREWEQCRPSNRFRVQSQAVS